MRLTVARVALWLAALAALGCGRAPSSAPPTAAPSVSASAAADRGGAEALPTAYPAPLRGAVAGTPFEARTVLLWQDASAAWLSFERVVPATQGAFDPRAMRAPADMLCLYVDPARLRVGRFEARDGAIAPDSPIRYAVLQQVSPSAREIHLTDRSWRVTLTIQRIIKRTSKGSDVYASIEGTIDLRFTRPAASLRGAFLAHDLLADADVADDQPRLPGPAPAPAAASPASLRPSPTSPGRTD